MVIRFLFTRNLSIALCLTPAEAAISDTCVCCVTIARAGYTFTVPHRHRRGRLDGKTIIYLDLSVAEALKLLLYR